MTNESQLQLKYVEYQLVVSDTDTWWPGSSTVQQQKCFMLTDASVNICCLQPGMIKLFPE